MSDWARAVGTQVVNEGFITVVPDLGTNEIDKRAKAVRDYFVSQPGSNERPGMAIKSDKTSER